MMAATQNALPAVREILEELHASERLYDNELRSSARTEAVLPAEIFVEGELECFAFTKNVSEKGICLISPQPCFDGEQAKIRLSGLHRRSPLMAATCRWTCAFGSSFWASGWQIDDGIDVEKVLAEDCQLSFDQRGSHRERLAIPVIVHPKYGTKVHCFSRNVGGNGVCLIGQQQPAINEFSLLEIVRSNGKRERLVAECKWSYKVGDSFWISGWQFPLEETIATAQMQYFDA